MEVIATLNLIVTLILLFVHKDQAMKLVKWW